MGWQTDYESVRNLLAVKDDPLLLPQELLEPAIIGLETGVLRRGLAEKVQGKCKAEISSRFEISTQLVDCESQPAPGFEPGTY